MAYLSFLRVYPQRVFSVEAYLMVSFRSMQMQFSKLGSFLVVETYPFVYSNRQLASN